MVQVCWSGNHIKQGAGAGRSTQMLTYITYHVICVCGGLNAYLERLAQMDLKHIMK